MSKTFFCNIFFFLIISLLFNVLHDLAVAHCPAPEYLEFYNISDFKHYRAPKYLDIHPDMVLKFTDQYLLSVIKLCKYYAPSVE